jgi:nucleoside-diphosphate-sugar epimerase
VLKLVSDNSKARQMIGWTPRTSLDDGLIRTIEHIRKNPADFHLGYAI